MMIRPAELRAIKSGEIDLAFRRWDRPRVRVGTRMRTRIGLVEVTSVEAVADVSDTDARRAGYPDAAALRTVLDSGGRGDRSVHRVGLRWAGADPREELRATLPDEAERVVLLGWLDRLDRASASGPWTRATLRIIDRSPGVRAPDLAAELGRPTADFKRDVRKLKERGLTESLDIGYRLSPRGSAVLDHGGPRREREAPAGMPLPHVGAPASRALTAAGVRTLEDVAGWRAADLAALHGVGPMALQALDDALAAAGLTWLA